MKLKTLVIHNIASIQDATIHFDGPVLNNEHLFLITGETGSGKSTILDCLCLALFNETPRTGNAKDRNACYDYRLTPDATNALPVGDVRNLMRRNTTECKVVLTFETNDGTIYTATWETHRARNKAAGNLQSETWSLASDKGLATDKKNEIKRHIHDLLGINAEQFYRSVMLPQGRFAEFLTSSINDKSEILESLTGTAIYRNIGKQIYQIFRRKQGECQTQENRISANKLLQPEEIEEINRRIASLKASNEQLNKLRSAVAAALTWQVNLAKMQSELQDHKDAEQKWQQKLHSDEFKEHERLVKQWNHTSEARKWHNDKAQASRDLERNRGMLADMAGDYQRLAGGIAFSHTIIEKNKKQLIALQEKIDKQKKEIETLTQERNNLDNKLQGYNIATLNNSFKRIGQQIETTNNARNAYRQYLEQKSLCEKKQKKLDSDQASLKNLQQQLETIDKQVKEKQQAHDKALQDFEARKLLVHDFAVELRGMVKPGEQCPVCGHVIDKVLDNDEMRSLVAPYEQAVKKLEGELNALTSKFNKADAQARSEASRINDQHNELAHAQSDLAVKLDHAIALGKQAGVNVETPHCDDAAFEVKIKEAKASQQQLGVQLDKYNTLNELKNKQQQEIEKSQNQLEKHKDQLIELEKSTQMAEIEVKQAQNVQDWLTAAVPEWQALDIEPQEVDQLSAGFNSLKVQFTRYDSYNKQQQQVVQQCSKRLEDFGRSNGYTLERIAELASYDPGTIERIDHSLRQAHQQASNATALVEAVKKRIDEHQAAKPELWDTPAEQLEKSRIDTQASIEDNSKAIGACQTQLNDNDKACKQLEHDRNILEKLRHDMEQWEKLCNMLGNSDGKTFMKIAQSFILGDMLNQANYYLRMFTTRFQLECQPGSLIILVRDTMQGDTPLPATNLSGGESFMASLALALALAQMNGGQHSLDTIFIDEGFGSLSDEPLNQVVETLERLYQLDGRRVGIISHVDVLKERIAAQIQVTRDPGDNTRSLVKVATR